VNTRLSAAFEKADSALAEQFGMITLADIAHDFSTN
jgi:hypothetical protein